MLETAPAQSPQIPITLEWIRSISTLAAVIVALGVALFGDWLRRVFFKPKLNLDALVRRPDAEKVGRQVTIHNPVSNTPIGIPAGEAWFFRLAISNQKRTPARDVQVYLKSVSKADGTLVDKFTPMNLKWTHTGETTRKVLLKDVPVFCDFIHISDPTKKSQVGEDLNGVAADKGVICLDVEATTTAKSHLLGPGAYRFELYLAAENCSARKFTVEVRYDGSWTANQDQMFDQEIGFRMRTI